MDCGLRSETAGTVSIHVREVQAHRCVFERFKHSLKLGCDGEAASIFEDHIAVIRESLHPIRMGLVRPD